MDTWRKRGHSPECWQDHAECALKVAKDICDTRAAQDRTRADMFGRALRGMVRDAQGSSEVLLMARMLLMEYHEEMKGRKR